MASGTRKNMRTATIDDAVDYYPMRVDLYRSGPEPDPATRFRQNDQPDTGARFCLTLALQMDEKTHEGRSYLIVPTGHGLAGVPREVLEAKDSWELWRSNEKLFYALHFVGGIKLPPCPEEYRYAFDWHYVQIKKKGYLLGRNEYVKEWG